MYIFFFQPAFSVLDHYVWIKHINAFVKMLYNSNQSKTKNIYIFLYDGIMSKNLINHSFIYVNCRQFLFALQLLLPQLSVQLLDSFTRLSLVTLLQHKRHLRRMCWRYLFLLTSSLNVHCFRLKQEREENVSQNENLDNTAFYCYWIRKSHMRGIVSRLLSAMSHAPCLVHKSWRESWFCWLHSLVCGSWGHFETAVGLSLFFFPFCLYFCESSSVQHLQYSIEPVIWHSSQCESFQCFDIRKW